MSFQEERKIYTLTSLAKSLEKLFLDRFGARSYWITAEITKSNVKGAHRYFELADSLSGLLTSKIQATMWNSAYRSIKSEIGADLDSILVAGNKVLFEVKIEYHRIYGIKLNVVNVDPSITYGDLEKKKLENIEKLKKEQLFDKQSTLYLSPILKRIALIGSPDTSGYRDFMNELFHNNIFTNFKVAEFACSVQGEKAAPEIIKALKEAQQYNVEVIIIVRGGGSKMDLNVFNDYNLSKEICLSSIPVMTGIGHETDEVIADLVSSQSHITPTALAKHLYTSVGIFSGQLTTSFDTIIQLSQELLLGQKDEFNHVNNYFIHYSTALVNEGKKELIQEIHHLELIVSETVHQQKGELELLFSKTQTHAFNSIELAKSTAFENQLEKVLLLAQGSLDQNKIALQNLTEKLDLLNPITLLKKGYTISTIDATDLNQFEGELTGKELKTVTNDTLITSTITKIESNGKN